MMTQNCPIELHFEKLLSVADVTDYARSLRPAHFSREARFENRISRNREFLESRMAGEKRIYGVTSGFGNSSSHQVAQEHATLLQRNLYSYHGCGVGTELSKEACAATLLVRSNCLTRGYSGVSLELVQALDVLLSKEIHPVLPSQGSVGASGDLTPLSYVAAALEGQRRCYYSGGIFETSEIFSRLGIKPYRLKAKEALAVMNGTSVMTALACLAWREASLIAHHCCALTSLVVSCLNGRLEPYSSNLHALKCHPGQALAAEIIREHLFDGGSEKDAGRSLASADTRLQDSYSLRCAPQVLGVLFDTLLWSQNYLEVELNSVNDNPVIRDDTGEVLNGGHFFGGHVASACDALKTATANAIALLDKQLAILIDARLNGALLPDNLVARQQLGELHVVNHGFKAMQITFSALTAESLKTSAPASIHSRSTECLNQDVVSLGTIAARDLLRITSMGKNAVAIMHMALRQAIFIRETDDSSFFSKLSPQAQKLVASISECFQPVIEDRALDHEIVRLMQRLFEQDDLIQQRLRR